MNERVSKGKGDLYKCLVSKFALLFALTPDEADESWTASIAAAAFEGGFDEVDAGLTGCMGSASLETELKKKIIYTFGLFPNSFLCRFLPFICP